MARGQRTRRDDFTRGYFCAVAALLRIEGFPDTNVKELFRGADPSGADPDDKALFIEHGLMACYAPGWTTHNYHSEGGGRKIHLVGATLKTLCGIPESKNLAVNSGQPIADIAAWIDLDHENDVCKICAGRARGKA